MGRKTEDGHRVRGKDKAMNTFNKYGKFSAKHSRTMEAASENKKIMIKIGSHERKIIVKITKNTK